MPHVRKMPCPVTVRSGITSKNYEDVIGKQKIGRDVIGKFKIYEDVIGKLKIVCSSREEKNYEDVIGKIKSILLLFGCKRKNKNKKPRTDWGSYKFNF